MKTITYLFAVIFTLSSLGLSAQSQQVNTENSSIHWLGKKIGGQHDGFIELASGQLEEKEGRLVSGSFVIDMTSISNTDLTDAGYNAKLLGHLMSDDFFGVESFPTATLILMKASTFKDGKASANGDLTIKGITQPITFDIVKESNSYSTTLKVDRSKFNVKYGSTSFFESLGDKAIDDIFTLDIELAVN